MSYTYLIHKQHRLVITVGKGDLTFPEVKECNDELQRDPDFDPHFNQLVDLTNVTKFDVCGDEARSIARWTLFLPTSRRAFVGRTDHVYGIERMISICHEMQKGAAITSVFRDKESAIDWLYSPER